MTRHAIRSSIRAIGMVALGVFGIPAVSAELGLVRFEAVACADNAGFALAPKSADLAIDARGLADLLEGDRGSLMRPVIEAFAGEDAMATFDLLLKRANAPGEKVARDVFGGRVAFFIADEATDSTWVLGFESDDQRCEHVLRMLRAKMISPGRFESAAERLVMRRVGGWLLVAPLSEIGRGVLDDSARRVPNEDPGHSLLGEPLVQPLLASDAPVRMFVRHGAPAGGATTMALRGEKRGLRAEILGSYDEPPLGLSGGRHGLDLHLVRAFEDRAVLVMSNPANGIPARADAFWLALLPELMPTPAMRATLAGERIFLVGSSQDHAMPAIACAWRVEDAEQARGDQDHFMRGVCCGLTRGIEQPRSDQDASPGPGSVGQTPDQMVEARRTPDLGPFVDRYLGRMFKLGASSLLWRTVSTPCGGWQLYASDPRWLVEVEERLAIASCSDEERPSISGAGFCDGPRAAALMRRWQPLTTPGVQDRVAKGLSAISDMMEKLGRVRFRYDMPSPVSLRATVEIEPPAKLAEPSTWPRVPAADVKR